MLTDTGFSWIWDTDEFLKLGRKQKENREEEKKKKPMVKKWKVKASRKRRFKTREDSTTGLFYVKVLTKVK